MVPSEFTISRKGAGSGRSYVEDPQAPRKTGHTSLFIYTASLWTHQRFQEKYLLYDVRYVFFWESLICIYVNSIPEIIYEPSILLCIDINDNSIFMRRYTLKTSKFLISSLHPARTKMIKIWCKFQIGTVDRFCVLLNYSHFIYCSILTPCISFPRIHSSL